MKKHSNILVIALVIFIAALTRVLPHPWNFTALGAMALFSGRLTKDSKIAYLLPWAAMLLSDFYLGFHGTMIYVYGAFLLTSVMGVAFRNSESKTALAGQAIGASLLFFALTNFGVWFTDNMYAHTFSGLMDCYLAGIPFLRNQVAGDLFYSFAIAYALQILTAKSAQPIKT